LLVALDRGGDLFVVHVRAEFQHGFRWGDCLAADFVGYSCHAWVEFEFSYTGACARFARARQPIMASNRRYAGQVRDKPQVHGYHGLAAAQLFSLATFAPQDMKIATILIALSSLVLTACLSLTHHNPSVAGRWSQVGANCIWEFRIDGTVYVRGGDGSVEHGRYALLGSDRIALDFGDSPKASVVEGVVISDEQLSLMSENGEKSVFERLQ
jgi:hypothetical protein